jgi:glycosyltransferase involved in cell wall biosynthesis
MSAGPLVSVVVCSYNAGAYLHAALGSLLDQSYRNFEVLVLDDGSTDGSVDEVRGSVRDRRIRWFRHDNIGRPSTLNRALGEVRGEFVTTQDADDVSHPERLARLVGAMLREPELAAVFSGHEVILKGRTMAPRFRAKGIERCQRDIEAMRMPAHDPTALYRMSMVSEMRYEPALKIAHAVDYILRLGEARPMTVIGECLYSYRVHSESITKRDPATRLQEVEAVLVRACERRRVCCLEVLRKHRSRIENMSQNQLRDNNLLAEFIESTLDLRKGGQVVAACGTALQCIKLHPMDRKYYKPFAYACAPRCIARRWRQSGEI